MERLTVVLATVASHALASHHFDYPEHPLAKDMSRSWPDLKHHRYQPQDFFD